MKNLIIIVLVLAAGWFGWQRFTTGYWAEATARDFVEELRLGMDSGYLSKTISSWRAPLPEKQLTLPTEGISPDFTVRRDSEPVKIAGRTTIYYLVTFGKSPVASGGRSLRYEYRLTLANEGTDFIPKWTIVMFHPTSRRANRDAA